MLAQQIRTEKGAPRSWMIVMAPGNEAKQELLRFAGEQQVASASFFGVGAFERAIVGYFEWENKAYKPIRIDQQVEVLSLIGDIVLDEHDAYVMHAHTALGLSDGTTRGGHLIEGHVRPTLELTVMETPANLVRRVQQDIGIALIEAK